MLPVAGLSIPAAEHSTITSWGREGEVDAFKNMLTQYPEGLVAVVSDSYNVFEACEKLWGSELKEMIKNRNGTLVVRPDSGDPPVIVPQLLDILGKAFEEDVTTTSTGHKLLPPCIRMIQGDGISYESLGAILDAMAAAGWAADNLAFGSGGALLQKLNRDTQKCAFKCSEITPRAAAAVTSTRTRSPIRARNRRWASSPLSTAPTASSPPSPKARAILPRTFSLRSSVTATCSSIRSATRFAPGPRSRPALRRQRLK